MDERDLVDGLVELGFSDEWHKNVNNTGILIYRVKMIARLALAKAEDCSEDQIDTKIAQAFANYRQMASE